MSRVLGAARLHADLTILAKLVCALTRAVPLAAYAASRRNTGPAVDPVRLKGALPRRAGRVLA